MIQRYPELRTGAAVIVVGVFFLLCGLLYVAYGQAMHSLCDTTTCGHQSRWSLVVIAPGALHILGGVIALIRGNSRDRHIDL